MNDSIKEEKSKNREDTGSFLDKDLKTHPSYKYPILPLLNKMDIGKFDYLYLLHIKLVVKNLVKYNGSLWLTGQMTNVN